MGGEYMERWSPKPELDFRFRLLGYAMAGAPIVMLAAGRRAQRLGMWITGVITIVFAVVLSLFSIAQSVGTMSLTAENMAKNAEAFERVETTDDDRLEFLKQERQLIIDTRDSEIVRIEGSIDAIRNDGIRGIPRADQDSIDAYNARIDTLRNEANAEISRIGDEIKAELETAPTDAVLAAPMKFDPMVVVINWFTSLGNPTDGSKKWITIIYLTAIGVVICLIGQTLTLFLEVTARRSERAEMKDPVRVKAGKKAADTRKRNDRRIHKIAHRADSYRAAFEAAKKKKLKNPRYLPSALAKENFKTTLAEMENALAMMVQANLISTEDRDLLLVEDTGKALPASRANRIDIVDQPLNGQDNAPDNASNLPSA
jgi:hypothetical protein